MKIFIGFIVFVSALALSSTSFAENQEHGTPVKEQAAGAHQAAQEHGSAAKAERDNTALFPAKQANKDLSTPPAAPELVGPAFMKAIKESSITLEWKPVEGVEVYNVQVATDPNFKWLKLEQNLYKGTSLQVSELEAGKQYYWRVAAVKPDNMATFTKSLFTKSMFKTSEVK